VAEEVEARAAAVDAVDAEQGALEQERSALAVSATEAVRRRDDAQARVAAGRR